MLLRGLDSVLFWATRSINSRYAVVKADEFNLRRIIMWTTPAATEMRFGFEVTMYVMNQ